MKKKVKCEGYTGPRPQAFADKEAGDPSCQTCGVKYSKHPRPKKTK